MTTNVYNYLADVDWGHMDGDWGVLMMLGMALFWIAVIVLVVWLVRRGTEGFGRPSAEHVTPMEILDRRFAEGEITREEYRERREELRGSAG
jgi:putative membrane protein